MSSYNVHDQTDNITIKWNAQFMETCNIKVCSCRFIVGYINISIDK